MVVIRKVRKYINLSAADRAALWTAVWLLARARWRHLRMPVKALMEDLKRPNGTILQANSEAATKIAWALATAAPNVPWRSDCLVRAIAAHAWAEKVNIPCEFHLGVRKTAGSNIEAHAWTLSDGQILSGEIEGLSEFQEFKSVGADFGRLKFHD